ncbi:MAG: FliG C-terminal domain-containing protein [Pseudomonadota bacterium]
MKQVREHANTGLRGRFGPDTAAHLMRALGDGAAPIWSELTADEARAISDHMDRLPTDNPHADRDALESFLRASIGARQPGKVEAGTDLASNTSVWTRLGDDHAPILAALLGRESPQVAAWMVSQMDPKLSATVLRMLEEDTSLTVLERLLELKPPAPPVAEMIETTLADTLDRVATGADGAGHQRVARIFDQIGSRHEQSLLAGLDAKAPGSGEKVRAQMFTFNDLAGLGAAGMQTLLAATDRGVLTVALKGARADVANVFFSNLTRRAGLLIREELSGLGALRRSEVEEARAEIVELARQLIRGGQIRLVGATAEDDDELVE